MAMKIRFRLIYRGERGSTFYCVDSETGKRYSLKSAFGLWKWSPHPELHQAGLLTEQMHR